MTKKHGNYSARRLEKMWRLCPSAKELSLRISSYDNLPSDKIRSSLLYCSLFPEDFPISKMELILRYEIKDTTLLVFLFLYVYWKKRLHFMVSLMSNKTEKVSEIPSSHDPLTLLLQHNYLEVINNDFFQSMHSLRVLNL
ncbi:hypothetical protein CUMW_259370 [Citrus unshiu]|uniref:Uncharacterized protein n=1 Tax=Citrus unshiu TaxID=55188 RepID=A0A2H5QT56_CITUN|nr:hypothetical protein CUMW_259370 [Citrus unshiu]